MQAIESATLIEHHLDLFRGRLQGVDGPLQGAVTAALRHVCELIFETRPSRQQLQDALEFLTTLGQASDERRQEWVLLADVLGVSALIERIADDRCDGATPATIAGPFYRSDLPERRNGEDFCLDGKGERLHVSGAVEDIEGQPICGASVEVWQANGDGLYENQRPDLLPEFNLAGRLTTRADGTFDYVTVRPAGYGLPEDGPVAQLFDRLGIALVRPAHIHARITANGYRTLTTHVFDGADPMIDSDALFSVCDALKADFRPNDERPGEWCVDFRFVLRPDEARSHIAPAGRA